MPVDSSSTARGVDVTGAEESLDVSVVLPVHNEQGHLRAEIDRIRAALEASHYTFEIIVVDDGSTDGSTEELRTFTDIRLLELARNRGTGYARRIGTRAARGEVVVWTDVDMTYPNDEIVGLVKELEGYDQVVGARTSEQGTARVFRIFAKGFIRRLAEYLVETPIPDLNSGFRAFRKVVALQFLHLLPNGFSCVTTLTMTFLTNGYSVHYVPIEYSPRAGESKFHWWKDTKRYLTQVIRMILSYNPLRIFLPVGTAMILVAFTKLGYDLITKDLYVTTNTLLMIFASFQVMMIGLLADLIVRVTRPRDNIDSASL